MTEDSSKFVVTFSADGERVSWSPDAEFFSTLRASAERRGFDSNDVLVMMSGVATEAVRQWAEALKPEH